METYDLCRDDSRPIRVRADLIGHGTNRNGRVSVDIYRTERGRYLIHTRKPREAWVEAYDGAAALVAGLHDNDRGDPMTRRQESPVLWRNHLEAAQGGHAVSPLQPSPLACLCGRPWTGGNRSAGPARAAWGGAIPVPRSSLTQPKNPEGRP